MSIEKFQPSYDIYPERIERLKTVAPEAFADGKINWDILRESLGSFVESEDAETEHYAFTWPGKREARRLAGKPPQGTLIPVSGEGVNEPSTENVFIEGDNLEVLKLLQKSYPSKIKLIYIDPPYNTGEDRLYEDNFEQPLEEYLKVTGQIDSQGASLVSNKKSDGRFHSKWLNIMYPRLALARNLLDLDGVIVLHIDENEVERLVLLMEEIFGPENNLGVITWDKKNPKGDAQGIAYQHESLIVFARDIANLLEKRPLARNKANAERMLAKAKELFSKLGKKELPDDLCEIIRKYDLKKDDYKGYIREYDLARVNEEFASWLDSQDDLSGGEAAYKFIDENGRVYRPVSMAWPNKKKAPDDYFIPLIHPKTKKPCPLPQRGWRNPSATMNDLLAKGLILFGPDETTQPNRKYYLDENMTENIPSVLRFGGSDDAFFKSIKVPLYDNPKPYRFVMQIIDYFTKDGDIVVDFFAGSGSVGHAIYEQSCIDKKHRKFILIQLPAPLSEDSEDQREAFSFCKTNSLPAVLTELGKERLRRSIKKMSSDNNPAVIKDLDVGFKVMKLQGSHFRLWKDYKGTDTKELMDLFAKQEDPLLSGWKPENLILEVMLQEGFPLHSKIESMEAIKANKVVQVKSEFCQHVIFICLDEKIDKKTIEQLPLTDKDIFICLDKALTDEQKVALSDKGVIKTI